jgi:hypothetical protein
MSAMTGRACTISPSEVTLTIRIRFINKPVTVSLASAF